MYDFGFHNADCMDAMKEYPDNYFDLAIVDPVYGDVTKGGYMTNIDSTQKVAKVRHYHTSLWNQEKTGSDYFKEILRVAKNVVICGVIILPIICHLLNVGLSGINRTQEDLPMRNLHGLRLIRQQEYFGIHGTV